MIKEEYSLQLDAKNFRSTNGPWNSLMLNDPWSVGYVTTLIELEEFQTKEEWEEFYYESGSLRKAKLQLIPEATAILLEDEQLIKLNNEAIAKLSFDLKSVNTQFGRTKADFEKKGKILFDYMQSTGSTISLAECIECVRYRVICETWNGVIIRERNTIQTLTALFPETKFIKVDGEKDHKYAVDYEAYKNNILSYAIQIKPKSYTWNAPYIEKARFANTQKKRLYLAEFKVPVFDIISDNKGNISNMDVLKNLK